MNQEFITKLIDVSPEEYIEILGEERYLALIEEEIRQKREFIEEHIKEIAVLKIDLKLLCEEYNKIKGIQNNDK